jgi:methionyl-tRNA formyltransferase
VKTVFLGTPEFAVPSLERTVAAGHEVMAVYTQPDRPKGRGQKETMPPVKAAALKLGIPVYQPERVRRPEVVEQLRAMAPEAMVVVGYGQIFPRAILEIAPQGMINVHASLLPKYRGAAPIQWAVARGETRTGVTTMRIGEELDTGDILLQWETEIGAKETAVELGRRLAAAGADLLERTLSELAAIRPEAQDGSQASYAPILKKEDGRIDWQRSPREILNRIRGLVPWPGCYAFLSGRRLHVWKGAAADVKLPPGALRVIDHRLYAGCSGGSVEFVEVQVEGKKRMPATAFLNGFALGAEEAFE